MITIGLTNPNSGDGSDWYRGLGAWSFIPRDKLRIVTNDTWDWTLFCRCDAIVMSRPYMPPHVGIATTAKAMRLPLIVDFDDDLFNIPACNPAYAVYTQPDVQKAIHACIDLADVVTVSTAKLGKVMSPGKHIVVPNSFNDYIWDLSPLGAPQKLLVWRGSYTHNKDCHLYPEIVADFLDHNPDWHIYLMGNPPWEFEVIRPTQRTIVDWADPVRYIHSLRKMRPSFVLSFLHDDEFNKSKSNCGWLEATACGAVLIAPGYMPEFQQLGIIQYRDIGDFETQLRLAASMPEGQRRSLWELSCQDIKSRLLLSKVNEMRLAEVEKAVRKYREDQSQ